MDLQEITLENRNGFDQISLFSSMDILIGAHGAAMTNAIFMIPNSLIYELFPPQWRFACYYRLSKNCDILYEKDTAEGEIGRECRKSLNTLACQYRGIRDRDFTMKVEVVVKTVERSIQRVLKMKYRQ